MKNFEGFLPDYPRTRHLPFRANAKRDDLIASEKEAQVIFESDNVFAEEKIDGSSVGIAVVDGQPVVRNRNHILNKAFAARTPAKMQFASIWNWYYKNQQKFLDLMDSAGPVTVYGEWMWALHGLEYDNLPDYFIPYDLFDHEKRVFLATDYTRAKLLQAGFATVPLLPLHLLLSPPEKAFISRSLMGDKSFSDSKWLGRDLFKANTGLRIRLQGIDWEKPSEPFLGKTHFMYGGNDDISTIAHRMVYTESQ
jgi:hypothetical protein